MEELNEVNEGQVIEKRPKFLLVISILSFVNIGITILTSLFGALGGKPSADELEAAKLQFADSQEKLEVLATKQYYNRTIDGNNFNKPSKVDLIFRGNNSKGRCLEFNKDFPLLKDLDETLNVDQKSKLKTI